MSTANQSNGTQTQSGADEESKENQDNATSLEDVSRRLKETAEEAKKYRQSNAELKAALDRIEQEKLEAQGKFKEVADKERERSALLEKEKLALQTKYVTKVVTSQVKAEAVANFGCIDPDSFLKLADLSELEVDDEFNIDPKTLKALLEKESKSKPYLFKKEAAQFRDGAPAGKPAAKLSATEELKGAKTQKELDAIMKKHGLI